MADLFPPPPPAPQEFVLSQLPPPPPPPAKKPMHSPQDTVSRFWSKFDSEHPGRVFTVLPKNPYARQKAAKTTASGTVLGQRVFKSYEQAREECIRDVNRIIRECKRTNQKYRDPHFDIEWDLKAERRQWLDGLAKKNQQPGQKMEPKDVRRVIDIFEKPQFYVNGASAGDIRQGGCGDCYLMAALCGLGNKKGLIERVCVKHDDECMDVGVYGFVFFRDGEWQQTIIDDKLYLRQPDYYEAVKEREVWDDIDRVNSEAEYRKTHQTGSRALYFAHCSDENEIWLPLLEKAYAKAHGDFAAIDGGFTGEAVEDLTGGITVEVYSADILDKELFWKDQLMKVGETFLFGCATGFYADWLDIQGKNRSGERQGLLEQHAYSVMEAREATDPHDAKETHRLVKVRNPWGRREWNGKWSDGSAEWTPEWMKLLDHRFGNDGIFWISYEDFLKKFQLFDRTRIFSEEWSATQCWTSVDVAWADEYHSTKFQITLKEKGKVVIVLSQLDDKYFEDLQGRYRFDLRFRLENADSDDPNDYIVRSNDPYGMSRSVSTDIELEAGVYNVLIKVTATKYTALRAIEDVLPDYARDKREKLIQIGLSYDLAHAKGVYVESREEKEARRARAREERKEKKRRKRDQYRKEAEREWKKNKKRHERDVQSQKRKAERRKARATSKANIDAVSSPASLVNGLETDGSQIVPAGAQSPEQNQEVAPSGHSESSDGAAFATPKEIDAPEVKVDGTETSAITSNTCGAERNRDHKEMIPATPTPEGLQQMVKTLDEAIAEPNDQEGKYHSPSEMLKAKALPTTIFAQVPPTLELNGHKVITDVKPLPFQPKIRRPEHVNMSSFRPSRTDTIDTNAAHSTFTNGPTPSGNSINDTAIDSDDSYGSFEWDSALDGPPSCASSIFNSDAESSSDESDTLYYLPPTHRHLSRRNKKRKKAGDLGRGHDTGPPLPPPNPAEEEDDFDDTDPWNAVCVVGLRVYSTIDGGVELKVVYPPVEEKKGRKRKAKNGKLIEEMIGNAGKMTGQKLDPDDPAKGAVVAVSSVALYS